MTNITDDEVNITVGFDDAVQAIAYLSDMLDFLRDKGVQTQIKHIETAKEICEAFCYEHFQEELKE